MAAQTGLCLAWSETPEDTFCRFVGQVKSAVSFYTQKSVIIRFLSCYLTFSNTFALPVIGRKFMYVHENVYMCLKLLIGTHLKST